MWVGLRIWDDRLPDRPLDRLIGASVLGLFVGRIAAMLSQGINPLANPADIIIVRGGVAAPAATLAALAAIFWPERDNPSAVDALAPAAVLGLAGWHAGCLWRGACLGAASDLPWAWSGPTSEITRHPIEVYAAIALIAGAWLVSRLGWRPLLRTGTALGLASLVRLVTEPLRPTLSGGPIGWYAAGVVVGLFIAVLGPRLTRKPRTPVPT